MTRGLSKVPKRKGIWLAMLAALAISSGILLALVVAAKPAEAATPIKPTCSESLQALIDVASPGSVVQAPGDCVYRETITIDKPLSLKAGSGAEIRGSDVWTNWKKRGRKRGAYWRKGTLPSFSTHSDMKAHGSCVSGTSRCFWPEQVFLDGKPLTQVASAPKRGQFAVDDRRRVVLSDNPADHRVEVSVRQSWVLAAAKDVSVEGFTMKHAANSGQSGALANNQFDNMTVRNNNLSWAHGANVNLGMATGLKLIGNTIHHGGQIGVSGYLSDLAVQDNKIYANNTERYDPWWHAGGIKATHMLSFAVDGNEVYNNFGSGVWCDIDCNNTSISGNRVYRNKSYGIHYEISKNAKISDNTVWENGWVRNSPGEPGILISSSHNIEVYGNTLAWNRDGIMVVNADRDGSAYDQVTNVQVHNNNILAKDYKDGEYHFALAWVKTYPDGKIYESVSKNRGYDNRYYYNQSEGSKARFKWKMGPYVNLNKLGDFNSTHGEERGRYVSETTKNAIAASKSIPASSSH